MTKLTIKTPAKINIGLYITEKRNDGYHNLETFFYPIRLYDEIQFEEADRFSFDTNISSLKTDPTNLIIKAKQAIEKQSGKLFNIKIFLKKNIPIGAGLGGGSSDAAAVLSSLNKLFHLNLSEDVLRNLALQLGSDVPFFLNPVPSFASSRGEVLSPVDFKIDKPILIVNPGIHLSTKWAFGQIKPAKPDFDLRNIASRNWSSIKEKIKNDFEEPVFAEHIEIKKIKDLMYNYGAELAMMTGSGSTVFGIFEDMESAVKTKNQFNNNYFTFIDYEKN